MKVRKKNGSIQDFNISKIKLTLERVSDEQGMPFTGSDLRMLTESIQEEIEKMQKEIVSSAEIHKIVVEKLKTFGFTQIAEAYDSFEKRL